MKFLLVIALLSFVCCKPAQEQNNRLTAMEEADHWTLLFDGKSLDGWHIYNEGNIDSKWTVNNGELVCDPKKKTGIFGDLVTDSSFQDFELLVEWKVSKGGNSGVFINVKEDSSYAATFATGLEMQLLDNTYAEHRHQIDSTHWAGCLYAVDCIGKNSQPMPHNEWNKSRIVQQNGKVTFWLNDKLTFERQTQTEEFKALTQKGSMKAYPDFAKYPSGKIALQNHTDSVAFRNIKIKRI